MMFSSPMAMMLFKLIVVLAATGCLSTPVRSAPVVRVGESFVVAVGETVTVPILVSEALDLKSFQFDLGYDETILELLAFTDAGTDFEEATIAAGGLLLGITGFPLPGLLSGAADSMIGVLDGMTGTGSLVYVEFLALSTGVSALTLSHVYLDSIELGPDAIVNGQIAVPEPQTVALLVMALVILAKIQVRRRRLTLPALPR
jgi:hypothetical protein